MLLIQVIAVLEKLTLKSVGVYRWQGHDQTGVVKCTRQGPDQTGIVKCTNTYNVTPVW